jgi:hypothetical protein
MGRPPPLSALGVTVLLAMARSTERRQAVEIESEPACTIEQRRTGRAGRRSTMRCNAMPREAHCWPEVIQVHAGSGAQ